MSTRKLLIHNTATPPNLVDKVVMPKLLMVNEMTPEDVRDLQNLFDFNVKHHVFSGHLDVAKYLVTLNKK